jgi:hypothetical protein
MADDFGLSFSPLQPPAFGGPGSNGNNALGNNGPSPVQEAIRILSLRIPRVVGAGALAPLGLLNSLGASGLGTAGSANPFAHGTAAWLDFERRRGGQPGRVGGDNGNPIVRPALPDPAIHYGGGGSGGNGGDQGGGPVDPLDRWGGHTPTMPGPSLGPVAPTRRDRGV